MKKSYYKDPENLDNSYQFLVFSIFAIILVGFYCSIFYPSKYTPVLILEDGPIKGSVAYSRDGLEYWQYLGIPFAKPPIGKLAYAPPQDPKKWKVVRSVTKFPSPCLQYDVVLTARVKGKLDCLYANVFVNKAGSENVSLPVLVYIYGGGFISGSSDMYQPDYFMDEKIIVVTFNYRLGPYGFLNLGNDSMAPGNMALLDQNKVLKWVQKNIGHFGGDPNRVTLMGESAGAVATHLHVLSPMSNKLFQKAIILSGTAIMPWAVNRKPEKLAQAYAKMFECGSDLEQCYANMTREQLGTQDVLLDPLAGDFLFRPSIDSHFLKETPEQILKSGQFPDIPVMFSANEAEGVLRSGKFAAMPESVKELDQNWDLLINNLLVSNNPIISPQVAQKIRTQYFGNESLLADEDMFLQEMTDLVSDFAFFRGLHQTIIFHAKRGAPVYTFYFNYTSKFYTGVYSVFRAIRADSWIPSELSLAWTISWDWWAEHIFGGKGSHRLGVGHGEDCYQFWNMHGITKYFSWFDKDFSKSAVKGIVDFVYSTKPLSFRGVSWPAVNNDLKLGVKEHRIPYMLMDNEPTPKVISEPFADRIKFWENL